MGNFSTIGMCKTPFAKKRVINHCGKNMHTAKKRSKNKTNFFSLEVLLDYQASFLSKKKVRRGCNKKKTDKESSRREEGYNQKNVQKKKVLPLLILLMVAADLGKSQGTKFWRNKKFLTAGN